jgi:hypothetical protein
MKCSNPDCSRGIGLVHYRRYWFSKRLYSSKLCRDLFVAHAPKSLHQGQTAATTYFEWLFLEPVERSQPKPVPAVIRRATR